MAGRVTIATVAQHARVSRQTVSNVINAPHLVRPETRERVRAAIEALGYRVSQAARQMRTGRSRLIAVRIGPAGDGINGSVLDRFLHGLTEAAAPAGYRIVLYSAASDDAEIATYDELLGAHDLDGFVLTGTHPGDARTVWLTRRGVPFVTFGRPWAAQPEPFFGGGEHAHTQHSAAKPEPIFDGGEHAHTQHSAAKPEPFSDGGEHARTQHSAAKPEPIFDAGEHAHTQHSAAKPEPIFGAGGHPWVDVDGASGTRDATRRLLAAGHRRIGFIGWPPGSAVGDDRREGWAAALREVGGDPTGVERRVPDGVATGERAALDLLAAADPTALVCASDSLALGALRAAAARNTARDTADGIGAGGMAAPGRAAPRRIAVIGFDDTPVAQAVGLTSVSQPLAEAAAGCVALLTRLLDGRGGNGRGGNGTSSDGGGGDGDAPGHLLLRPRLVVRDSG
jgi:DNA-binding LacI/PurR family transcriptional regulator